MEEVGEVAVAEVKEALAKEHCHVRIPVNHLEEKVAEGEEEVVEEEEEDGLSHQHQDLVEVPVVV